MKKNSALTKVILVGITKSFKSSYDSVLNDVNATFEKGHFYHIEGISGSGKTTLFNIIGTLDKPNDFQNTFKLKSFFRKKVYLSYLQEQIKLSHLDKYFPNLLPVDNENEFKNKLNEILMPDNDKLYNYYSKYKKRLCVPDGNENILNELFEKYSTLPDTRQRKFKLIILDAIFFPTLRIDLDNPKFEFKEKITDNGMKFDDLRRKAESLKIFPNLTFPENQKEELLEKELINFFNKLIHSRKTIISKYYDKIKDNFDILDEDKDEFKKYTDEGYDSLENENKMRFNRLMLETLFYPMFIQSPDWINVKYFVENNLDKKRTKFKLKSFFLKEVYLSYLQEQIKLSQLDKYFPNLLPVDNENEFKKILNEILKPDNDKLYNYYSDNNKRLCVLDGNEDNLNELFGKYSTLTDTEQRKFKLIILDAIFFPTLRIDLDNLEFESKEKITDNIMKFDDLKKKEKAIKAKGLNLNLKSISGISSLDSRNENILIDFFNKLINPESKVIAEYYDKIKDNFDILDEDKDEFKKYTDEGYDSLENEDKMRFNRLMLETLFYPMFYLTNDNLYFEWSYQSKTVQNKLTALRKNYLRTIYQDFRLIECFSAIDNILLAENHSEETLKKLYSLIVRRFNHREPDEIKILKKLKEEMEKKNPSLNYSRLFRRTKKEVQKKKKDIMALSGGQKQLIGLIRAAITEDSKGKIFLADEPTGQMDLELKEEIYGFLYTLSKHNIVIVVSHDDIRSIRTIKSYIKEDTFHCLKLTDGKLEKKNIQKRS